jgi:hypothetical protein
MNRRVGTSIPTPAHLAADRPTPKRCGDGTWAVWSAPKVGPPFVRSTMIASGFDSREEAQGWIDDH